MPLTFLYYFWYILASVIDAAGGIYVTAYHAMIASIAWCGIALAATLVLVTACASNAPRTAAVSAVPESGGAGSLAPQSLETVSPTPAAVDSAGLRRIIDRGQARLAGAGVPRADIPLSR